MSTTTAHITRIGTVFVPVGDQDRALQFLTRGVRLGEGVPPMFTFRDQDGNRYRVVERD